MTNKSKTIRVKANFLISIYGKELMSKEYSEKQLKK